VHANGELVLGCELELREHGHMGAREASVPAYSRRGRTQHPDLEQTS
jgi:hypothetical protein